MSDSPDQEDEVVDVLKLSYDGETFQIQLQPTFFDDPRDWGDMLAEIARGIARSISEGDEAKILAGIQAKFNDVLDQPPEESS